MNTRFDFSQLNRFAARHRKFDTTRTLSMAMLAAMMEAQGFIADKHLSAPGRGRAGGRGPYTPNPFKDQLRVDTGYLRGQFLAQKPTATPVGNRIEGKLSVSSVIYLARHEFEIVQRLGRPRAPLRTGLDRAQGLMANAASKEIVREMKRAIGYG